MHEDEIVPSTGNESVVHLIRSKQCHSLRAVRLASHRNPYVGVDDVGVPDGGSRIAGQADASATCLRVLLRCSDVPTLGLEHWWGSNRDVGTQTGRSEHQRMGHVVIAVSHERYL